MEGLQANTDNNGFTTKLKEAETCHAMGMRDEACQLYEQVLSIEQDLKPEARKSIQNKILQLQKEIKDLQESENKGLTAEDIFIFKKTLTPSDDIPTIMDGAAALRELGLMDEALTEYEKLLSVDYSAIDQSELDIKPDQIIMDYLACMLETAPPEEVVKKAYKVIYQHNLDDKATVQIKFWLGRELEKRNQHELSVDLYTTAAEIDPDDQDIAMRLNALKSKVSSSSRYDYLLRNKFVTTNQLQEALTIAKKMNKSVEFVLVDRFRVKRDQVGKSLSLYFGVPFRQFDPEAQIPFELINNLKKSFLIYYVWVPLTWDKKGIEVMVDDPKDLRKTDHIRALMNNQKITFSVGIKEDIIDCINHFFDPSREQLSNATLDDLDEIIPDVTFEEEEDLEDDAMLMDESSSQVVKFVDQVLVTAFRQTVSDIHIEPSPVTRKTTIRFRTDGVCHEYIQVPNNMAPAIISRLKIMAELDIAEKRLPQDGKIKMRRKGIPEFELRISTMPTAGRFEDAVMRILTRSGTLKLDEIGLNDRNLGILKKIIRSPYGLILCVGPTGSGKTTTLHSALAHINDPSVKIWTAEDPVEITQAGLRQVQVRPKIGLDFARVMRGFLRLDPDIIMIGEMRDKETASIGIEAALTGHLVLSTLHTNNAPETLTRMLDMGMNPLNISDAFLGVVGQRLVRRLCPQCSETYKPTEKEFEELRLNYGEEQFDDAGFTYAGAQNLKRADGCENCSGSGYRGRVGIHELMEATQEIKILIKKNATSHELAIQAVKDGMTTLRQDGIMKILEGLTNLPEVRRVCVD